MTAINLSLKDQVVLITGGSRGIGKAIALTFAEAGANVAIAARDEEKLKETKSEIVQRGVRCLAIRADLSMDVDIVRLHQAVKRELGDIDILVNNAGIGYFIALTDLSREQFDSTMGINTWACLHLSQLCYSGMRKKGKGVIINVASTGAFKPDIFAGAYSASKAALVMLTKQLACEWGSYGIRCVAICPGLVRTDMTADLVSYREKHGFQNLLDRCAEPEEIAAMALFLASPAGSFCQGEAYLVNGGSIAFQG